MNLNFMNMKLYNTPKNKREGWEIPIKGLFKLWLRCFTGLARPSVSLSFFLPCVYARGLINELTHARAYTYISNT